jgi:hypothetical protein
MNPLELGHIPLVLLAWVYTRVVRTRNLFLEARLEISIEVRAPLLDPALGMTRDEHGIRVPCALVRSETPRATFN